MRSDIYQQLAKYTGTLKWSAYTAPNGYSFPGLELPLFIKEHPLPIRRPKITEVNTIQQLDPATGTDFSTQTIFFGTPDPLQMNLSGWVITPILRTGTSPENWTYRPTVDGAAGSTSLSMNGSSYVEVVMDLLTGFYNQNTAGSKLRKDPDFYYSPYGNVYTKPHILAWEGQFTASPKKQSFTMTLQLEY